jgi:hypothetical protein
LVVIGVAATVAIAAYHPPYDSFLERWGSALADSLVVIGVAVEIKFGQMAGLRQSELRRRSDEKAVEANERAATANQKAEQARLELARFTTPRSLSLSQQKRIASKIRSFTGIQFDAAVLHGDIEALDILERIEGAVRAADWMQLDWREYGTAIGRAVVMDRPGLPAVGNTSVPGILIQFEVEQRTRLEAAANALASALSAEGIPAIARANMQGVITAANTNAIHIFVGQKA